MAEIQAKFGDEIETELQKGDRGAFEVLLDGVLIYSKLATRQFPRYGEILRLITEQM